LIFFKITKNDARIDQSVDYQHKFENENHLVIN